MSTLEFNTAVVGRRIAQYIGMTPLIGLISMLVSTKNQRIGDHVATTIVRSI